MTVGLVVVSHSRALARAAVALAREMARGEEVPIAMAAGLDENTLGTDAAQIAEAIVAVDRGDGVVVLMDLGSAVLSAELALELIDDEVRDWVVLSPAPLVEGLVVAAVTAAGGAGADRVATEAAGALRAKIGQLAPQSRQWVSETGSGTGFLTGVFVLTAAHGLHARPAARLAGAIARHHAFAELRNRTRNSPWVPAASLAEVMTLDGQCGDEMELRVRGPQAAEVLRDVRELAGRDFGELAIVDAGEGER